MGSLRATYRGKMAGQGTNLRDSYFSYETRSIAMKVLVFGATGMVGQGVLRECLLDPDVDRVQTIGRSPTGIHHPKLREVLHRDLSRYAEIEADLFGFDACFFSLACRP